LFLWPKEGTDATVSQTISLDLHLEDLHMSSKAELEQLSWKKNFINILAITMKRINSSQPQVSKA
jgi:hypothetical protein